MQNKKKPPSQNRYLFLQNSLPNTLLPLHLKLKTYLKASGIFHLQRLLFFGVSYDAIFKKVPWIRPTQI